jgi:hypothetical protein
MTVPTIRETRLLEDASSERMPSKMARDEGERATR